MSNKPLFRFPNEGAVAFANRRLKARGRTDVEWRQRKDGGMYLTDVEVKQGALDV